MYPDRSFLSDPKVNLPHEAGGVVQLSLEDDVAVGLVELAVSHVLHLVGEEVFDLPHRHAGDLPYVFVEKFLVVQGRTLESFVPALLSVE